MPPRALLLLLWCLPPSSHTLHLAWLLCSASCARSRASSSLHSGCRPHTLTVLFLTRLHYLPITQHEPIGLCPRRTCFSAFMSHAPSGLAALRGVLRSFPCFRLVPLQAAAHTQRWCSSQRGLTTYPSPRPHKALGRIYCVMRPHGPAPSLRAPPCKASRLFASRPTASRPTTADQRKHSMPVATPPP
jgi:hypothetical protein